MTDIFTSDVFQLSERKLAQFKKVEALYERSNDLAGFWKTYMKFNSDVHGVPEGKRNALFNDFRRRANRATDNNLKSMLSFFGSFRDYSQRNEQKLHKSRVNMIRDLEADIRLPRKKKDNDDGDGVIMIEDLEDEIRLPRKKMGNDEDLVVKGSPYDFQLNERKLARLKKIEARYERSNDVMGFWQTWMKFTAEVQGIPEGQRNALFSDFRKRANKTKDSKLRSLLAFFGSFRESKTKSSERSSKSRDLDKVVMIEDLEDSPQGPSDDEDDEEMGKRITDLFKVDPLEPYRDLIVKGGKEYVFSYVIKYSFDWKGRDNLKRNYHKQEMGAYSKKVEKDTDLVEILEEIIDQYKWNNNLQRYDFEVHEITFKQEDIEYVNMEAIKLKGSMLHYKFLGNVRDINKVDGECVLDYIVYETARTKKPGDTMRAVEKHHLVAYFGEKCLYGGVSTSEIMRWAADMKYISCYALDPLMQTFRHHVAKHVKHLLVFIVNNGHLYPVLDEELKAQAVRRGRIQLSDCKFDVKYDKYHFLSAERMESDSSALSSGLESVDKRVILLETDNLSQVITDVSLKTKFLVHNMDFQGNKVVGFEHPVTQKIYVSAVDHDERLGVCDKLYEVYKCVEFSFTNQSYAQIANTLFEIVTGQLPKSTCSPALGDIFDRYKIGPYVARVAPSSDYYEGNLQGFDLRRCYTGILLNNTEDFNVFSGFDYPEPLDHRGFVLCKGEYYIRRTFCMGNGTIKVSRGWFPTVLVRYALSKGYIQKRDLGYVVKASSHIKADFFKNYVETVIKLFGSNDVSKTLINCFIGFLNQQYVTSVKGCVTSDHQSAMGVLFSELGKGNAAKVHNVNELYFVRSEFKQKKSEVNVPIYRHVLASSYIELDKLYHAVCDENSVVASYNTDSIKVQNPKQVVLKDLEDCLPGDIRTEVVLEVKGTLFDDLPVHDAYEFVKPEWKVVQEIANGPEDVTFPATLDVVPESVRVRLQEFVTPHTYDQAIGSINDGVNYCKNEQILAFIKENSCLVSGQAGSGKTWLIKRAFTDKSIVLVWTNRTKQNLKDQGVVKVFTFDEFFAARSSFDERLKKLSVYETVFIDEYGIVPPYFFELLSKIKGMAPTIQFKIFGETTQCEPFTDTGHYYDYNNSQLIMNLTSFNFVKILYRFTRYDKSLYDIVVELNTTRRLPPSTRNKKAVFNYTNITYHIKTRDKVNAECLTRFIEEFSPETCVIDATVWAVGMPVIANENIRAKKPEDGKFTNYAWASSPVFTSQVFKLVRFTQNSVMVMGRDEEIEIPKRYFTRIMDPGFAITVYRYQGSEISGPYTVHDLPKMSVNQLYTAISRGKSADMVHFDYTDRVFKRQAYTTKSVELKIQPRPIMDGSVYQITDSSKTFSYIGCFWAEGQTAAGRLKEHRENPVSEKMKAVINNSDIEIKVLESIKCLSTQAVLDLENDYIRKFHKNEDDVSLVPPVTGEDGAIVTPARVVPILNIKIPKERESVKVAIVQPLVQAKMVFNINDDKVRKVLTIDKLVTYKGEKKRVRGKWCYNLCGLEQAMAEATRFRDNALMQYCN